MLELRPLPQRPLPAPARWTPWSFHLFFLGAGLLSGVIFHPPALLLPGLSMAAAAWALHRG